MYMYVFFICTGGGMERGLVYCALMFNSVFVRVCKSLYIAARVCARK